MFESEFSNGDLLRDKVTGLEGVVMVVAFYSTGCIHYGIQPKRIRDDGEIPDWTWLDESRFSLVEQSAVKFDYNGNSGSMPFGPQV